ncbi:hypothetical protein BC828DRAFT_392252 [Blastocladiella britannica]|nr:hypothetical protein BC828DRAFT_392252 [Blastocladiella britannica]
MEWTQVLLALLLAMYNHRAIPLRLREAVHFFTYALDFWKDNIIPKVCNIFLGASAETNKTCIKHALNLLVFGTGGRSSQDKEEKTSYDGKRGVARLFQPNQKSTGRGKEEA